MDKSQSAHEYFRAHSGVNKGLSRTHNIKIQFRSMSLNEITLISLGFFIHVLQVSFFVGYFTIHFMVRKKFEMLT